jgi:hypothetical protein
MLAELREQQEKMNDGHYLLVPEDPYARFFLFMGADAHYAYIEAPALGAVALSHTEFKETFKPLILVVQGKAGNYLTL